MQAGMIPAYLRLQNLFITAEGATFADWGPEFIDPSGNID